ncbi:MAG: hypothetical protein IIY96_01575 [Lachnospiraceae bacterium]|nr:hypothetical protein [Lachnospiraceae bacterium]
MRSQKTNSQQNRTPGGKRILYDAHGIRVKGSPLSNKFVRFLLFGVLPYLVINGIILLLVCSTPKISIDVKDTNDYISTNVNFSIHSVLPIKEMKVTMESEPVEYEKSGSNYTCSVSKNGTFYVEATSVNGMMRAAYADVSMLDDTAPSVDEESANISNGALSFLISDTQSGVNYDSIYAIVNEADVVYPSDMNRNTGLITIPLPGKCYSVELYFEDMVGNARSGHITVNTMLVEPGTADEESTSEEETEAS